MIEKSVRAVEAALNLEIMLNSAYVSALVTVGQLILAVLVAHLLLSFMDWRSSGGFGAWRKAVMERPADTLSFVMAILGLYYIVRFAVVYLSVFLCLSKM